MSEERSENRAPIKKAGSPCHLDWLRQTTAQATDHDFLQSHAIISIPMPLYAYTAINRSGKDFFGERESKDSEDLRASLRSEGLMVLAFHDVVEEGQNPSFISKIIEKIKNIRGVTLFDRLVFSRNLSVMIRSGLSMTRALGAISEEVKSNNFKLIIQGIIDSLNKGKTFSEALTAYKDIFGELYINMVQAGELSGKLDMVLLLLARQMKKDYDLRSRVRGALIYPAIIVSVLVAIGFLFMVYVIPTLSETLKELNVDLPWSTQIIIFISNFIAQYAVITSSSFIIILFFFVRFVRSPLGKPSWDKVVLKIVIIGSLIKKMNMARFARTLAYLLSSGVPILRSLEITSAVVGNTLYQNSIIRLLGEVTRGKTMGAFFHQDRELYDPLLAEMVVAGEETGKIAAMLLEVAVFFEQDINETTKNFSSIIEPFLMVIIGVVVGFFALSVFQPIYGSLGAI